MTLRKKTLAVIALSLGALVAGLYISGLLIVEGGFAEAERNETIAKVDAARKIVATMVQEFSERSDDWADWDDTAKYLADGNAAYEEGNVDYGSFAAIGWDLFMVVQADGTPRVAVALDRAAGAFVPVPAGYQPHMAALLAGAADYGPPVFGLGLVDGKVMLLSSRAIRNTDESPGAVSGRLITARLVDEPWMQRLQRFTFLDITFTPQPSPAGDTSIRVAARSERQMAGWTHLTDIHGQPIVLMRIDRDRAIRAHGQKILRSSTTALVVGGVIVALLALLLVGRGVLRPLARLIAGVRRLEGGERTTVEVASNDELGELARAFNQMAATIVDREASLRTARARTRLVLDSTGDAIVTCALTGEIDDDVSAAAVAWFGAPAAQANVADYLAGDDTRAAFELRMGLDQIEADLLPFELLVDQMPKRLARGGRSYALSYRRIDGDERPRLLIVVSDVTALVEAEAAEAAAREEHAVLGHLMRDRADFERFIAETEQLIAQASAPASAHDQARALHTLKGNAGVYGMASIARAAHHVEDLLVEGAGVSEAIAALAERWRQALARIADHRKGDENVVYLPTAEHDAFARRLEHDGDRSALLAVVRSWRLDPARRILDRLGEHVRRIAERRGHDIDVVVDADHTRIDAKATAGFWSSLVHVIRNAVDHGIEDGEQRVAAGKPARGQVRLSARTVNGGLRVTIADDGAGIDWARLVAKARARGVALHGDERLAALFADGVSTRDEVSELSGRGIGMGAVRAACDALDGHIEVASTPGQGTTFTFWFGASARAAA